MPIGKDSITKRVAKPAEATETKAPAQKKTTTAKKTCCQNYGGVWSDGCKKVDINGKINGDIDEKLYWDSETKTCN